MGRFPNGKLDNLAPDQVKAVLLYHVVPAAVKSGDLQEGAQEPETLAPVDPNNEGGDKKKLTVTKTGDAVTAGANNAQVTTPDVLTWNGVVHIVDAVLEEAQPGLLT